jgi:hypothetical protein
MVVYLKRAGGQSQYSALLDAQAHSESDKFVELEQWIAEHLRTDLGVEALAQQVHMSPRNFACPQLGTCDSGTAANVSSPVDCSFFNGERNGRAVR